MSDDKISAALVHWSVYVRAKKALLEANVVRSFKAAEADFAEWLVKTVLNGSIPTNKSNPSFDVRADGKRIQVKSVCKAFGNHNGYIVSARDRKNDATAGASHYAFVFFSELEPEAVFLVPEDVVRDWGQTQIKRLKLEKHTSSVKLWPLTTIK